MFSFVLKLHEYEHYGCKLISILMAKERNCPETISNSLYGSLAKQSDGNKNAFSCQVLDDLQNWHVCPDKPDSGASNVWFTRVLAKKVSNNLSWKF